MADLNEDVCLTTNVCRLLRDMPKELKGTEGLVLASLPSDNSLRSLVADKSFVCLLIAINDTTISQSIARRMLSK